MERTNQGVEPFSISLHNKYKKWFAVQKKLNFFDVRHVTLILIIFFQQNQVYMSYCLHLSVVTFTNFFTKGIFIKNFCAHTGVFKSSTVRYITFGMTVWPIISLRARLHETRSELKPVWNLKSLWKVVPFTW